MMSFTKELLLRVKDEAERMKILTIFRNNLEARSYKLREASALEVGSVAEILKTDMFSNLLLDPYLELLKDSNTEVRKNAIKQMSALATCLDSKVFLDKIYVVLPSLAAEANPVIT